MPVELEDAILTRQALAYVIELYRELSAENGAPSLGTQNQVVDFIRTDPELRDAVARWAQSHDVEKATTELPRRLPDDACLPAHPILYGSGHGAAGLHFGPGQHPGDRR